MFDILSDSSMMIGRGLGLLLPEQALLPEKALLLGSSSLLVLLNMQMVACPWLREMAGRPI